MRWFEVLIEPLPETIDWLVKIILLFYDIGADSTGDAIKYRNEYSQATIDEF